LRGGSAGSSGWPVGIGEGRDGAGLEEVETFEFGASASPSMVAPPASPVAASPIDALAAPHEVRIALRRLCSDLSQAARGNLVAVILYGGLARGRYRPGSSDVNIVLVLRDTSKAALAAIAPTMRAAWRAIRLDPIILTPDEIPRIARSFPIKFLDVKEHHVVLLGDDPLPRLEIPGDRIRARVQQELLNLALRLRRSYIAVADDPPEIARMIGRAAVPLAVQLGGLLRLRGRTVPDDGLDAVFSAAAEAFGLDRETLAGIQAVRAGDSVEANLGALHNGLLRLIAQALDAAGAGGEGS
jgi:predicted nucleotidyltransferase